MWDTSRYTIQLGILPEALPKALPSSFYIDIRIDMIGLSVRAPMGFAPQTSEPACPHADSYWYLAPP